MLTKCVVKSGVRERGRKLCILRGLQCESRANEAKNTSPNLYGFTTHSGGQLLHREDISCLWFLVGYIAYCEAACRLHLMTFYFFVDDHCEIVGHVSTMVMRYRS